MVNPPPKSVLSATEDDPAWIDRAAETEASSGVPETPSAGTEAHPTGGSPLTGRKPSLMDDGPSATSRIVVPTPSPTPEP